MAKQEVWTCGTCDYTWPRTKGALPVTGACPRCGATVAELQAEVDERDAVVKAAKAAAAQPEG